ncbi:MAG: multidrug efflux pump, inner rane subunit [Acidobacteria bacterium]|nr:multidrug efflux pump, inner rane subunit [Acidobacteriota bacterium]
MILNVARTHWKKFRRDRAGFVMTFVLPIVFFTVFAVMFGGAGRGGISRLHVALIDQSGGAAPAFMEALRSEKALDLIVLANDVHGTRTLPMTAERAQSEIRTGTLGLAIVIPAGFSDARLVSFDDRPRPGVLILADTSDPFSSHVLSGLLQKIAISTARSAPERGRDQAGLVLLPAAREALARASVLVNVTTRDVLGESKANPRIAFSAAGLGVMFLLFTASAAGGALIDESENGTLDRILSSRVSMTQLLVGKLLYLVSLSTLQLFLTFAWGALIFGVELWKHLPGFFIMTLCTSVATSSFGLLLAATCRTRAQLGAVSNLVVLVMSALGGSMFPRFLMPPQIQKLGLITINAWALDGYLKVFWREEPLLHLWPQVTALLLGGALIFTAARVVARKWETT